MTLLRRQPSRPVAATLVAELEAGPLAKPELQAALGVGPFTFGKALAEARLADYVTVRAGAVHLTEKGRAVLEEGRQTLSRAERRRLDRRRRP
jgi:Mn-dependent DtxR family transcriptional regulator